MIVYEWLKTLTDTQQIKLIGITIHDVTVEQLALYLKANELCHICTKKCLIEKSDCKTEIRKYLKQAVSPYEKELKLFL